MYRLTDPSKIACIGAMNRLVDHLGAWDRGEISIDCLQLALSFRADVESSLERGEARSKGYLLAVSYTMQEVLFKHKLEYGVGGNWQDVDDLADILSCLGYGLTAWCRSTVVQ